MQFYNSLLTDIKQRIHSAQIKAIWAVNTELLSLYWEIGRMLAQQKAQQEWGTGVITKLAKDLQNEFPEQKGFSERNLKFMVQFYSEYADLPIRKQAVSQLDFPYFMRVPWGHHILLMQKIKEVPVRFWYMQQIISETWSRQTLAEQIKTTLHLRKGKVVNNFADTLPNVKSEFIQEHFKDPYIFDFLTLHATFTERELEIALLNQLEKFLLELGKGFAFVGRQYCLSINEKDFYIDLLFYHLKMRCFVVIDLKKGEFKPEYAGKMQFYCSAVDNIIRHPDDKATIGLILCQNNDKVIAEYTLKNVHQPIGISEYELTKTLPADFRSCLPSIEDIETEFSKD